VFPPFRSACDSIWEQAAVLWDEGRRVEALAELRRNERDHPAGPALVPLRREVERALGLEPEKAADEQWRPRGLLAAGFLLSIGLFILTALIRFFSKKDAINTPCAVTPALSRGYKGVLIMLVVMGGICLYGLGDSARRLLPGFTGYALVWETNAYRVPQDNGAVSAHLKEGERVLLRSSGERIRSGPENWAYADGVGWVRVENIIFY
jgi:hypothetical protein